MYCLLIFLGMWHVLVAGSLIVDSVPLTQNIIPSPDAQGANVRLITVYLPQEAVENPHRRYPVIYYLPGLGGNYQTFTIGNKAIMDELIITQQALPMIIVHVDGSLVDGVDSDGKRRYLGTWYINSDLNGNFEDFFLYDLIPYVDAHYPTIADKDFRGVMGQSMGGFGAMYYAVNHPELFSVAGQASGTAFFILLNNTELFAPDQPAPGKEMFIMNSLLIPEIPESGDNAGYITPDNGPLSFSVFSYAAAFSPNVDNPPYFVDLPFELDSQGKPVFAEGDFFIHSIETGEPIFTGKSLVPRYDIIQKWRSKDPFNSFDVQQSLMTHEYVYHDGGDNELINAVGARAFSDAMAKAGLATEYLLYRGGHTTCLTTEVCARHRTMFQFASARFAKSLYTPLKKSVLKGTGSLVLHDQAMMQLSNNAQLAIESEVGQSSDITITLQNRSSFLLGSEALDQGAILQVGNDYSKAHRLVDGFIEPGPISFHLLMSDDSVMQLNSRSVFGIGAGVVALAADNNNYAVVNTLENCQNFSLQGQGGQLICNSVGSCEKNNGSLLLVGKIDQVAVDCDKERFVIKGGSNALLVEDSLLRHPVVLTDVGRQAAGGIRNNLNTDQAAQDYFLQRSIGSHIAYNNVLKTSIVTSLEQRNNDTLLTDPYKIDQGSAQDLYQFLALDHEDDYVVPTITSKEATLSLVDGMVVLTYIDQGNIIHIPEVLIPASYDIDLHEIAKKEGTVLIRVESRGDQRVLVEVQQL